MEMVDMSAYIAARSDQLNADDLLDAPRTITITKVTASPDSAEQPVSIHYEGDNSRPFKPCKTVRRILVGVWGKDASQYVGRSMTLYRDPTVAFGGMQVGGIRVSHMSHIDGEKTVALMVTRGRKAPFKVKPLTMKVQPASDEAVALQALTDAAEDGLDALANVWKQKWMAPHRDALQVDLDRLKVVAAQKAGASEVAGPDDEGEPEREPDPRTNDLLDEVEAHPQKPGDDPAAAKCNAIIGELKKAGSVAEITRIWGQNAEHFEALGDLMATLTTVKEARLAEIKAGKVEA